MMTPTLASAAVTQAGTVAGPGYRSVRIPFTQAGKLSASTAALQILLEVRNHWCVVNKTSVFSSPLSVVT